MPVKKLSDLPQKISSDNGDGFVITSVTGQDMRVPFQNLRENLGVDALEDKASLLQADIDDLEANQLASTIGFETKALMDADLAHDAGTVAQVMNDATSANNGYYRKDGASGEGSWVKRADLHAQTVDPADTSEAVVGKAVGDYVIQKHQQLFRTEKKYWNNAPEKSYEIPRGDFYKYTVGDFDLQKSYMVNDDSIIYTVSVPIIFNNRTAFILDFYRDNGSLRTGRIYAHSDGRLAMDSGFTEELRNPISIENNKPYIINIVIKLTTFEIYLNDSLAVRYTLTPTKRQQFTNDSDINYYAENTSTVYSAVGSPLVSFTEHLALPTHYENNQLPEYEVLAEQVETTGNTSEVIPFKGKGGSKEVVFSATLNPKDGWDGYNGNLTAEHLKIVSEDYYGKENGIRLFSGFGGTLIIYSVINDTNTLVQDTGIDPRNRYNVTVKIKPGGFVNGAFQDGVVDIEINNQSYSFTGDYINQITATGGKVVFKEPYTDDLYFYDGVLENLRIGYKKYLKNEVQVDSRKIVDLKHINNVSGGIRFNPAFNNGYSFISNGGFKYQAAVNPEGKNSVSRAGLASVEKSGIKKIYLPHSITGDAGYVISAALLEPDNGSSIQMVHDGFDVKNQYIHPSVDYSATAINGFKYWCFVSNYPREHPRYEDDDLLCSTNGIDWTRVKPFGEAAAGEPQLPPNVFLTGTDNGRENSFVPIPAAGETITMNGSPFVIGGSLKHDPEIIIKDGYIYLYNFYNFYEPDGQGGYDTDLYHRFVVVFRSNNGRDWEICRTDGSTIAASAANIEEIFTQSTVDTKNNYIRYYAHNSNPSGGSNMQVVFDSVANQWWAYYKEYGGALLRYPGTSQLDFNWLAPESILLSSTTGMQEHPDVLFYDSKFYIINVDSLLESTDGVNFTKLSNIPFPCLPAGKGYKTDVCIGDSNHLFVYNGCLPATYSRPTLTDPFPNSKNDVATAIHRLPSMASVIDFAKNGKNFASIGASVTIYPKDEPAKAFNSVFNNINDGWYNKELAEYEFKGDEEVAVFIYAYGNGTAKAEFLNVYIE